LRSKVKLVLPGYRHSIGRVLLMRVVLVLSTILIVFSVFYIDRSGIRDTADGHLSTADILYFTVITVTTVGYGDVVPVSTFARMFDAFAVTLARLLIWLTLLRTTYELALSRYLEGIRMKRLKERLTSHVVVCGFGELGRATVANLLEGGFPREQIVILDPNEKAAAEAAETGVAALAADATKEEALNAADIVNAKALVAATGRDDTNILICLTAKALSKSVTVIGRVKEAENMKLMEHSGADMVVSPEQMAGVQIAQRLGGG